MWKRPCRSPAPFPVAQAAVGTVIVRACSLQTIPTLADYTLGGCEISLVAAIDVRACVCCWCEPFPSQRVRGVCAMCVPQFTQSNGDPSNPTSLHHLSKSRLNQYQLAIQSVGSILMDYDTDKEVPAFGFGFRLKGQVHHCYPLTLDPANPVVHGVEGLQDAYRDALPQIQLHGPTNFADVIRRAAQDAQHCTQARQRYTVLLIITDGIISDMVCGCGGPSVHNVA